jgi:hypothetical protein
MSLSFGKSQICERVDLSDNLAAVMNAGGTTCFEY